jgi:hypothetical protein
MATQRSFILLMPKLNYLYDAVKERGLADKKARGMDRAGQ